MCNSIVCGDCCSKAKCLKFSKKIYKKHSYECSICGRRICRDIQCIEKLYEGVNANLYFVMCTSISIRKSSLVLHLLFFKELRLGMCLQRKYRFWQCNDSVEINSKAFLFQLAVFMYQIN